MYLIVIVLFAAVLASLAIALLHLLRPKDGPEQLGKALAWRIGLSVLLFVLLIVAWQLGLIHPHGLMPGNAGY